VAGKEPAVLVLEDGTRHVGRAYGAVGRTLGEAVFATGMTGYQETLTDPSYAGQIVMMTAPHIGNTGTNDEDMESRQIWVAGFVVREPSRVVSNFRAQRSLDDDLVAQDVVGISSIDTRAVTRHIRSAGAMRAGIFSGPDYALSDGEQLELVRGGASMSGRNLSAEVSTPEPFTVPAVGDKVGSVAVLDLGVKTSTLNNLAARGLDVHVLPQMVTASHVLDLKPSALFFSNGPGDPQASDKHVELLREVLRAGVPYFGICFGNQLLGRALGLDTYKLPFGHQPARARQAHRPGRDHLAEPRLRRRSAHRGLFRLTSRFRPGRGQPLQPERQRGGGAQLPGHQRVQRAVPPRGSGRTARRQLPLRPLRRHDHGAEGRR
jgi:carbamoyl-phosphate synthase small subunit